MKYLIADLIVEMDTFGRTLRQAEPYRIEFDGLADGIVEARRLPTTVTSFSDDEYEYVQTGFCFSELLLQHGGLILHSSAVAIDGKAYCFSADSGVGKSTHAQLYRQFFGDAAVQILNDDKPALRYRDQAWQVYGTPWCGKTALNVNTHVPLAGICFLERGTENHIVRIPAKEALKLFVRQLPFPNVPHLRYLWISCLDCLIKSVPVYRMTCNMSPEAAAVSYAAMSGKEG